ncbi:aryl-alcohol oxidase 3 [Ancistrocladus abbreviatus]
MEGGCGACIVLLSKYDPLHDRVEDYSVSSCLTLLCSVNWCSITTTEGLGNSKDGFHPIHQRFAGFHASQCGFCTPGMCVSLFSALVNAEKTDRPEPAPGFSKLTVSEAEKAVAGNLCRCTGYRPITDVCKSFAADVDVEDLGFNAFWKKEESKDIKISSLPFYDRKNEICTFPEFLKQEIMSGKLLDSKRYSWCCPGSIAELQSLLRYCEGENGIRIKLVVSNTGSGYYKETEEYDKYIDLRCIPEMSVIKRDPTGIQIGAGVAITKAIESLREGSFDMFDGGSSMIFKKIADHLEKIASGFIRNSASVGGNLVMAQKNQFPSDIVTVLLAVNATVDLIFAARCETITLEELLERPPLDPKAVLVSVKIPSWKPPCDSSSRMDHKLMFETYRAAPRPLGNALPYLNAAFLAEISPCQSSRGITVNNIQLAFGAYGCRHAIRVRNAEEFLTGRTLDYDVLYEIIKLVQAAVVPQDGVSNQSYRSSLAVAYLFEFLHPLIQSSPEHSSISLNGCTESLSSLVSKVYDKSCHFDAFNHHSPLLASKQVIGSSKEYHPVGEPIIKTGAAIQASGEAVFVDDIPSPTNCLHGAFIYSTKPLARVNDIRFKSESPPDGVIAIISFKDIPKGGENAGAKLINTEPLFADDLTRCAGDRIALVVADTQKHADVAANVAVVDYDTVQLEAPILTVEEAVERSSFFEVPPMLCPKPVGDLSKGMAEADQKIMSAKVATACALAAYKLQRPVRMYLNRKADMIMAGGRHPMKITYSVGFKSDGKITALDLVILVNAGMAEDFSPMMPFTIAAALKKYDWGALSFDMKVCKTNHTSKSAMRGPGEVQGSFIADAVIEHIASSLSMEVDVVRKRNLHTYNSLSIFYVHAAGEPEEYTLPSIWDKLADSSSFHQRTEMVREFNNSHKWQKRGISRVPIVIELSLRPTPGKVSILQDGSISVEIGGIEFGQGLWTKVKQMTAFALGMIQCADTEVLLDKVRVIQTDTLSLTQSGLTGGSTTSESSCEAVRISCNILVERLTPLKERLQKEMGPVKWETLILQAYVEAVNLSASSYYVPDSTSMHYLNYGAAVSEVEVNLLTGETAVLQTDILYDCGQSLNPAVDLGQIEGAFVQGMGFFMLEEYLSNSDGLMVANGTWTYKIPTVDTIPRVFNVEVINSGHHKHRVLSSKGSGEPPLLLASSVHCATRAAIKEARKQLLSWSSTEMFDSMFQLDVPATMPVVKELCGLDMVERYLKHSLINQQKCE